MNKKNGSNGNGRLEQLVAGLDRLRLPVVIEELRREVEEGPPPDDSRLDFLWRIVEPQVRLRRERAVERRIRKARFPTAKSLDDFDFQFQTGLDSDLIRELATLDFVRRGYNVLLGGMSGTGKSHISIALGFAACAAGLRVRYTTSADMLAVLFASLATHELQQTLREYQRCELLIVDEVGLDRPERDTSLDAGLFYKVVQGRYEDVKSTIITTNIPWENWADYLGDALATGAILDRLVHRGYAVSIDGPSYRAAQHTKLNASLQGTKTVGA